MFGDIRLGICRFGGYQSMPLIGIGQIMILPILIFRRPDSNE